jgi:Zn-dependent protease/CBS domain-containing protein
MIIGKIWNVPIRLHLSWLLIFFLVTWSLATGFLPAEYPRLSAPTYLILGIVTSLLFFGSVLLHELGHIYVALREKIGVRGVTLFIFGGIAQIEQEPRSPGAEFRVAIAGPLVSLGLALIFHIIFRLVPEHGLLSASSGWLARINLLLAVFNMIPGFPLDGGRVLRAVVWHVTGSLHRATHVASSAGQLVALGFIGIGLFQMFSGNFLGGLWLVLIGWFLQNAATASYAQSNLQEMLSGVRVTQAMSPDWTPVSPFTELDGVVEERILAGGERFFLVAESDEPRGLVTLTNIASVPRAKWRETTVAEVMIPWDRVVHVQSTSELLDALRILDNASVNQAPVVEGDRIVGVLSKDQLMHYIRLRTDLGF